VRKIDLLYKLQEIDTQAGAARTQIARLKNEIGERGSLDEAAQHIEAVRAELRAIETQQRDLDLQAEERRDLIKAHEAKLYSGRVQNTKELGSLSEEVAQDRRQLSDIEDQLIELLDQIEEVSGRLRSYETAYARQLAAWNTAQEQARARLATAQATLASLETQRTTAAAAIDPAARSTYETLLRQKAGLAVGAVHQRTCQACRVSLTPSQEQRARIGTELITCHSCGRILYVPLG